MKNLFCGAVVSVLLVGCAAPRLGVTLLAPFDEQATLQQMKDGTNTIRGSALMRQQGGGVVTCAGFPAQVFPATAYAKERMRSLYLSDQGGYNPLVGMRDPLFTPDPAGYREAVRKTTCDPQGSFKFEKLADGEFYVIAPVAWMAGGSRQGGMISTLVTLRGGEVKEIVLAR